ncbi:LysR family transcriptional regulator [Neisseria wadsworthii]|uniref:LysR family transcriptional regulator n=1 Tax=Neisseria wadsworthii 9715 TaxID=1030841 RepID=G4CM68_9NEIS|nr:LysR family transcriptional regulator [Neisseria wadsworthii]EGZ51148.1 LysR family transcriptional regulator [Neisseria wadsworthii 9715]QMT36233.1 LysR family transcriptional regulator [Neisseria wadsworthii]
MEHIKKLPLKALKFFYFAGRYGSLSEAAERLHVTHGAVSKQMKILEAHLGTALFVKQGSSLALSEAGKQLYDSCGYAFEALENTVQKISGGRKRDLTVSCEPTLAMKWLIPRIDRFQTGMDVNVVILAAGGEIDFDKHPADIAIRRNDFRWSAGLYAEKLIDEYIGPVHIPGVKSRNRLHTRTRMQAWANWEAAAGQSFDAENDVFFEHFYLSIQAAIAGMGVAVASELMVEAEIGQGILQAPYGFVPDGSAYYALSPADFSADARVERLVAWLKEEMRQTLAR